MKSCYFAVLMFLSFSANAVGINQLGFLFDDNAEQVFSGQTVFWEDDGNGNGFEWKEGALDFNHYSAAAGGGQIFDYFNTFNNDTVGGPLNPDNVEIWAESFVIETTQILNPNPTTVSFYVSDNDPNGSPGSELLLEGMLIGNSFTVTGGALDPWFDTGVFVWNGAFSQNEEDNPFTLTMTASPVPVPAAAWLFMSGLIGMGAISRRRIV